MSEKHMPYVGGGFDRIVFDGDGSVWVKERTCHIELNAERNAVVCSECGSSMLLEGWDEMKDWGGNTLINTFKTYPYCPNCGARVITDNEPVEVWQQASADDVTCYESE